MPQFVFVLFIFSMISFITPFLVMFWSQLKKVKGNWNWKHRRMIKRSFFFGVPLGTIFLGLGIIFSLIM